MVMSSKEEMEHWKYHQRALVPPGLWFGTADDLVDYWQAMGVLPDIMNPVWQPFPRSKPLPEEPVELAEAEICWGGPSNFTLTPHTFKFSLKIKPGPDDDGNDEDKKQCQQLDTLERTECNRKTEVYKWSPPDDPDTYVEIERINEIWFTGPEAIDSQTEIAVHYVLKHPPPPAGAA